MLYGSKFFGGPVKYVLAGSGHIAGVVNPPSNKPKYQYWTGKAPSGADVDRWLSTATEHPGSWWPDWLDWLKSQGAETVPAREIGGGKLKAIEDAPGSYVKAEKLDVKAHARRRRLAMTILHALLSVASGSLVGFTLGLIGGGGSILAVPLLVYVVGVPSPHIAIGTSAMAVAASAAANLAGHARANTVKWPCALVFAALRHRRRGRRRATRQDGRRLAAC